MKRFKIFKRNPAPDSAESLFQGDQTTGKKLFCGEHGGYDFWEKVGDHIDGDGRPAASYRCPTCGHILWDTEKEYRESSC